MIYFFAFVVLITVCHPC